MKDENRWAYLLLGLGALAMVFPFLWMVATAFKPLPEIFSLSLLPKHPTLASFQYVLAQTAFGRWFFNSLLVATVSTVSVLFFDSLVGYTLAKLHFPGKTLIFMAILSTLMVPTEMLVIPWYMLSAKLHWIDTYWGLVFPGVMSATGVFLLRQFMLGIPNDLLDAARIDGVGEFGLYWRVALPQVRPALAALAILNFIGNWNAYLWPVIVVQSDAMRTVPIGIASFAGETEVAWNAIMAAATITVVPVLIIFAIFQRHIIKGVVLSGLKG